MQVQEIIAQKRDGHELSDETLSELLQGYLKGDVKDYHMAAWLMAVYFKGLSPRELSTWTRLMWKSGVTFERSHRNDFWIDKHSTGGVGDKTSLILVPLVRAVWERRFPKDGLKIPMVSGRGLGHSGGTLDKLESVPGFSPDIPISRALQLLASQGFFMMGQTQELAPADRLLYALRDVTATVESLPLIVSSIMSKKLSENLDGIVFDVKTGVGAFMKSETASRALAQALIAVAKSQGIESIALVTRMDEPLGSKVGHLLEVEECADFLKGEKIEKGLFEVGLALASAMISIASRNKISRRDAHALCEEELHRPRAFEIYREMFRSQGGDWAKFEIESARMRQDLLRYDYVAKEDGYLASVDAHAIGVLVGELGGARIKKGEPIDLRVGCEFGKKVGDKVKVGEVLVHVYYKESSKVAAIAAALAQSIQIVREKREPRSWIVESFGG